MSGPASTLEALSRTFIDSALYCIITMDADGRVQEFNPASERVFGFIRSEVVGKELAELMGKGATFVIELPIRGSNH